MPYPRPLPHRDPPPPEYSDSEDDYPLYVTLSSSQQNDLLRYYENELVRFDDYFIYMRFNHDGDDNFDLEGLSVIAQLGRYIRYIGLDVRLVAANIRAYDLLVHLWQSEGTVLSRYHARNVSTPTCQLLGRNENIDFLYTMSQNVFRFPECRFLSTLTSITGPVSRSLPSPADTNS